MTRFALAIATLAVLTSCTPADTAQDAESDRSPIALGTPVAVQSPAGPGSGEPFLTAASDGSILMSWLERADTSHLFRFSRLTGDVWSEPRTIAESSIFFVNWADFPSLIELSDGRLAAHWLRRSGPGTYSYDVWIAFSGNGGETWSEPVRPHDDGTLTEHGFVSLFEVDGMPAAVWLDGRQYADRDGEPATEEMTVRFATFDASGMPGNGARIDGRACDCCQTDAAVTANGPVVVYRDRTEDEIRDIVVSRYSAGAWSEPSKVHDDQWHINACPVNGPAIAADGNDVAVAWFTAAQDTARVNVAFSNDAGATFHAPVRIDQGLPSGRVDLLMLDRETVLVSWLERIDEAAHVMARTVSADGSLGAIMTVGGSSPERGSGFPRMVRTPGRVVFAWTVPGRPAQVVVAAAAY